MTRSGKSGAACVVEENSPIQSASLRMRLFEAQKERQESKLAIAGYRHFPGAPKPLPLEEPPFTLKDLRQAIPAHCFERSLLWSSYYLLKDIVTCAALLYVAMHINRMQSSIRFLLWPLYWFLQGGYMMGIWVMAHECGHQAFSSSTLINDTVGLILHGALMVPYHSWRISHRIHHSNTCSIENDEVFVPITKSQYKSKIWSEAIDESSLYNFYRIVVMLTVGWLPGYLVFNAVGPMKRSDHPHFHYNPYAPIYTEKERWMIWASDFSVLFFMSLLSYAAYCTSIMTIVTFYLIPLTVNNAYLVLITYLHHTDTFVPHFREGEWNWMRGALSTVDRSLGSYLDGVVHHVNDTHVLHHLFSKIPFYHAAEATEAVKPILGNYYMSDSTPAFSALWRSYTNCKYVSNEKITFYMR